MHNAGAFDVVVVGLGAMGAATLYQLARRGVRALGIDRHAPPHALGSSHGETRITRQAIGEGLQFVPLALRSHALWREIEAESGAALLHSCGAVVIAQGGVPSAMHGQADFLGTTFAAARAYGIAHERLDAREAARRFPQFALRGDELAYYEPGGGYLVPEACVATQLRLARQHGAQWRAGVTVRAASQHSGGARLVLHDGRVIDTGTAVICAGPWLASLVPALAPRLRVSRQLLSWFALDGSMDYAPARMPVFIWQWGRGEGEVCYGFPQIGAEPQIKVGAESPIVPVAPDRVARDVPPHEPAAVHARHLAGRLRGVTARCTRSATCLYTNTADSNFIIDRVPGAPNLVAVSACSGHGFKHSAAIGEAVAQMATSGATPEVLRPFAW